MGYDLTSKEKRFHDLCRTIGTTGKKKKKKNLKIISAEVVK